MTSLRRSDVSTTLLRRQVPARYRLLRNIWLRAEFKNAIQCTWSNSLYLQEFSWTDVANIYDTAQYLPVLTGNSLQVTSLGCLHLSLYRFFFFFCLFVFVLLLLLLSSTFSKKMGGTLFLGFHYTYFVVRGSGFLVGTLSLQLLLQF